VASFTHLHLHTEYSLGDSTIRISDLFPQIRALGMDAVAVTDNGLMFGAIEAYSAAKQHGVKLIFGCETNVAPRGRADRTDRCRYRLILLARNEVGYRNLSYLSSVGFLEGFYYWPRIDKAVLRERSDGLIGLSACMGGEVAQTLLERGVAAAEGIALEYASLFAPGDFFLEVVPTCMPEQQTVNDELRRIGQRLDIPLAATNGCHYLHRSDAVAYHVQRTIGAHRSLGPDLHLGRPLDGHYVTSPSEMEALFADVPEAVANAAAIAARCNVEIELGRVAMPRARVPAGQLAAPYLAELTELGLERRLRELATTARFSPEEYRDRCARELTTIHELGFSDYFLIVEEFVSWARDHDIPVAPGRGATVGCAVAWALRITDVDPLEYGLLFERFLNPERAWTPTIGVDFCIHRRDEVIAHLREAYGDDRVGRIATFHRSYAGGVIRSLARAMDFPEDEEMRLGSFAVDPPDGRRVTVREVFEQHPELASLLSATPLGRDMVDIAAGLEGLPTHVGLYPDSVVITERSLLEHVPCFGGQSDELIVQFAVREVAKLGIVVFDLFGLETPSTIHAAMRLVNDRRSMTGETPRDIDAIPMDDAAVYAMLARGETDGVFQLESGGMRELLVKLQPDRLEDLFAAVALYRPATTQSGMVDAFIELKHGRREARHAHAALAGILADTYGLIVYQEQVMQIAHLLAGYSLARADLLRRAMGKKDTQVLDWERPVFLEGARRRDIDATAAGAIFDLLASSAGFGFIRAHAVAYGWMTYQTAYLAHHFPVELRAARAAREPDAGRS
jgi:DNA polymerase-3 subunit alpha